MNPIIRYLTRGSDLFTFDLKQPLWAIQSVSVVRSEDFNEAQRILEQLRDYRPHEPDRLTFDELMDKAKLYLERVQP